MDSQLKKRFKSLAWRLGGTVFVSVLAIGLEPDNLALLREAGLTVPVALVAFLSLAVGEITKWINSPKNES